MSGTLALASALAAMSQETLGSLVRQRRVQGASHVSDPIGLATELLRPETLTRALAPLHRGHLAQLLQISETASATACASGSPDAVVIDALTRLGLLGLQDAVPVPLPEVTAALRAGLKTAGITATSLNSISSPATARSTTPDTHTWYASALTSIGESAEVLRMLRDHPGRLNRSGSIAVATVRSLSELTSIEIDDTSLILDALNQAGLLWAEPASQRLSPHANAEAWLTLSRGERWLVLAQAMLGAMPQTLRESLDSTEADLAVAAAALPHLFPLLPAPLCKAATAFVAATDHLGITVQGTLSEPAKLLISADMAAARELLSAELPPPAPGIYVQPDLSIVIPGTLDPADESGIATLSHPEHIGVAITRRVSETSLIEALERGVSANDARELFTRLSLTGIPQPLDYLLTSIAERSGNIMVSAHQGSQGQSRIDVSRPELGDTIAVDRSVQHLQLTRSDEDAHVLYSKLRPEHVIAALNASRYPASPVSTPKPTVAAAHGSGISNITPDPLAANTDVFSTPHDTAEPLTPELEGLVKRVFLAARSEPGTGDFTRLLELAIRDRSMVQVTAEARGQTHVFTLLPVSLSNGRLRATDTSAGMERTLPVGMITAVETL